MTLLYTQITKKANFWWWIVLRNAQMVKIRPYEVCNFKFSDNI